MCLGLQGCEQGRDSHSGQKLGEGLLKSLGNEGEVKDGDIPLPPFDIGNETPVHADFLGHYNLGPALLLTELSHPIPNAL